MEWSVRYKVALGTAKGLLYLHEGCQRRIIHRDIKAANILLTEDFEPQVVYLETMNLSALMCFLFLVLSYVLSALFVRPIYILFTSWDLVVIDLVLKLDSVLKCLMISPDHRLYFLQICDFGLAKWLPDRWTNLTVSKCEGTFGYVHRETLINF